MLQFRRWRNAVWFIGVWVAAAAPSALAVRQLNTGPIHPGTGELSHPEALSPGARLRAANLNADEIADRLLSRMSARVTACPSCEIQAALNDSIVTAAEKYMPVWPEAITGPEVKITPPTVPDAMLKILATATTSTSTAGPPAVTAPTVGPVGPIDLGPPPTEAVGEEMHAPAWLDKISELLSSLVETVESLGVPMPPSTSCPPSLINRLMCTFDNLFNLVGAVKTVADVLSMNARVLAGGRKATEALRHLHTLFGYPYGKEAMKTLGTVLVCQILSRKEITPDFQRGLALSLITKITGVPAAVEIDDVPTGSYAHLNIAVPPITEQRDMIQRYAKATSTGDLVYYDEEGLPHGHEVMSLLPPF